MNTLTKFSECLSTSRFRLTSYGKHFTNNLNSSYQIQIKWNSSNINNKSVDPRLKWKDKFGEYIL